MRLASRKICCGSIQGNCKPRWSDIKPPQEELLVYTQCEVARQATEDQHRDFCMSLHLTSAFPHFSGHGSEALPCQCAAATSATSWT